MTANRWVAVVACLVIAAAVVWTLATRGTPPPAIDLVAQFPSALKRPAGAPFDVTNVTVNGQEKASIVVHASARLIYPVTLPTNAWFRTSVALLPEVWGKPGDGMQFRVGVSDGRTYDDLFRLYLNPSARPDDRRWVPVSIDLSPYGGRRVDIILNTDASLPGSDDRRNDDGVWGAPGIYLTR